MSEYEITEAFTRLGSTVRSLDSDLEDATKAIAELRGQMSDCARTVRRLTGRVTWLENRLRASDAELADFDSVDGDLHRLAATAERGRLASARLLPAADRKRCETLVAQLELAMREHRDAAAQMMTLASTLQTGTPDQHAPVAGTVPLVQGRLEAARTAIASVRSDAAAAQDRLDEDDALYASLLDRIEAGLSAHTALTIRTRTTVVEAVRDGLLPPAWFAAALGYAPGPDAAAWYQAAADVLAYRVAYGIADAELPLGLEPEGDAPEHRRTEYARLLGLLREI
jgi:chromosome segregation ATPase